MPRIFYRPQQEAKNLPFSSTPVRLTRSKRHRRLQQTSIVGAGSRRIGTIIWRGTHAVHSTIKTKINLGSCLMKPLTMLSTRTSLRSPTSSPTRPVSVSATSSPCCIQNRRSRSMLSAHWWAPWILKARLYGLDLKVTVIGSRQQRCMHTHQDQVLKNKKEKIEMKTSSSPTTTMKLCPIGGTPVIAVTTLIRKPLTLSSNKSRLRTASQPLQAPQVEARRISTRSSSKFRKGSERVVAWSLPAGLGPRRLSVGEVRTLKDETRPIVQAFSLWRWPREAASKRGCPAKAWGSLLWGFQNSRTIR